MTFEGLLPPALVVALATCLGLLIALISSHRSRAKLTDQLRAATTSEKSAVRQLRLSSHNLRAIGMTLQGHAENLQANDATETTGIANAATGVLDIADYVHEWAEHTHATHVLEEETISLSSALDEAVSTVTRAISPGRRNWRIEPEMLSVQLRADRRALRHVLTRALSVSVRSSGPESTIRIRLERTKKDVELIIAEQLVAGDRGNASVAAGEPDLRLTLARSLMEAHGGSLEVEQGDALSIHIAFPVQRIMKSSDDTLEMRKVEIVPKASDDRLRSASVT